MAQVNFIPHQLKECAIREASLDVFHILSRYHSCDSQTINLDVIHPLGQIYFICKI